MRRGLAGRERRAITGGMLNVDDAGVALQTMLKPREDDGGNSGGVQIVGVESVPDKDGDHTLAPKKR